MSFDLWGGLLGKARRRQLEGQVKVAAGPLLSQALGGALTAAAVSHFGPGVGSIASAFIGGALKFGPPSGLMTPVEPGTVPLIPAIVQAISVALNKPKADAQAKAVQAAIDAASLSAVNRAANEASAGRSADKIMQAQTQALASQQQLLDQQKTADDARRAAWTAAAEQVAETMAETVLRKYLEKTGQFNAAEIGKVDAGLTAVAGVISEAETVTSSLVHPGESGLIANVNAALHTAEDFTQGLIVKTEALVPPGSLAPVEGAVL